MGMRQEIKYGLIEDEDGEKFLAIHGFMNPEAIIKALENTHNVCSGESLFHLAAGKCCPLVSSCLPSLATEIRSTGGSMNDFISARGRQIENPSCPLRQKVFGNFDGELKEPGSYADDGFFVTAVAPKPKV